MYSCKTIFIKTVAAEHTSEMKHAVYDSHIYIYLDHVCGSEPGTKLSQLSKVCTLRIYSGTFSFFFSNNLELKT